MNYEELEQLVRREITQREEEGCDVAEAREVFNKIKIRSRSKLEEILKSLSKISPTVDFPYKEPSDLLGIRDERLEGPRRINLKIPDGELLDKIYGGWLGRCAGCLLGKPVEGLKKEQIEEWLKIADAYPLRNYFPAVSGPPEWLVERVKRLEERETGVLLGEISHMARDDDIDYTVMGLHILETYGLNFTTMNVGESWLYLLPYWQVYTAERVAYRNLVNGLVPPETAIYMNPYREWIGAQIRADMWGYVTPGRPELGAEMAYRDASFSHVKNGMYGEMFVSAMISAAFATNDIGEIIKVGLSEIPKQSRLAEAVRDVVAWSKKYSDWKDAWKKVIEKYGQYHPVHTINNLALVLLGLLYGDGNYERSITISVMGGLDTDCNGATTGSILGVILGAKNLPEKWIKPLNDRIESFVLGFDNSRISDLAIRTFKLAKTVLTREAG